MKRTVKKSQPEAKRGEHWVFHRGALGDSVLLWPMLRQWRMRGIEVVLVCDGEKGRLAAKELGIRAEDAESAKFNALWVPGGPVEVLPEAVSLTRVGLEQLGAKNLQLRKSSEKYGPLVTEHNNLIFDSWFDRIEPALESRIKGLVGVVESGLFTALVEEVLVAAQDGVKLLQLRGGKVTESKLT